jgi:hypothetical protein
MSSYAVALKDPALPLLAPAAFLAGFAAGGRDASLEFIRSNPGFLGRSLPLDKARALAAAAGQAGFETILAAETDIIAPPPAIIAEKIGTENTGFRAVGGGALHFIPYDSILVFAAASYQAPAAPRSFTDLKPALFGRLAALAGLPMPVPEPAAPAKETFLRADIIGGEVPVRLLLKPEALDFSALGAERSLSSEANFRTLLARLSAPAFTAVKNHFLEAYISRSPAAAGKLNGPEACDTGLSLLLLLAKEKAGQ